MAELTAYMPALAARCRPAAPHEVISALVRLVPVFGVSDRSAEEWATFWDVYADALEGVPAEAIAAGARAFVARPDSEFFPKPGPLLALCQARATELKRARMAAEVIMATPPLDDPDAPTRQERHVQIEGVRRLWLELYRASTPEKAVEVL